MDGSLINANLFSWVICDDRNSRRILPLCEATSKHLIMVVYIRKVYHWLVQAFFRFKTTLSVTLSRRNRKVCRHKCRIISSCSQARLPLNWTVMPCAICEIITFSFFLGERSCDAIAKQQQRVPRWRLFYEHVTLFVSTKALPLIFSCIMAVTSSSRSSYPFGKHNKLLRMTFLRLLARASNYDWLRNSMDRNVSQSEFPSTSLKDSPIKSFSTCDIIFHLLPTVDLIFLD